MDSPKKKRSDLDQEEAAPAGAGCGGDDSGGGEISILGEDLLHEVLLRLPPSSLLSSLSVSKSWLHLCSSSLFRLSYNSCHASSFLGFFVNFPCQSPIFFPFSSSSAAVPVVSDTGPVQILDCRGGWLLLNDLDSSSLRLFHPIINKSLAVFLPLTDISAAAFAFHVLLPDPFSSDPLRLFRIVRVVAKPSSNLLIEVFSSESPGEWKRIPSSCRVRVRRCFSELHPVLVGGFLHWLNGDRQILALDEKSYDLSILGLPRELPLYLTARRCLGKLNERLCYAYVQESSLYIWVLVDRCYNGWCLEHRIGLEGFLELNLSHVGPVAFGGGSSPVVFLGSMEKVFSIDLGSGVLRELCDAGFEVDQVFPYHLVDTDCSSSAMVSGDDLLFPNVHLKVGMIQKRSSQIH